MESFVKSQYVGDMVEDFYHGQGKYIFEDGTEYIGGFFKGHFHGPGKMVYKNGDCIHGVWENGILLQKKLIFADGLEFSEKDWDYCTGEDLRFHYERLTEIKPIDQTFLSNDPKGLKKIMPGHYG